MTHRQAVTFGGSGLDRAQELRGDGAALAALAGQDDARVILLWRGKPLVSGLVAGASGAVALVRLAPDHPVLAITGPNIPRSNPGPRLFMGRADGGAGIWAQDLSGWTPPEGEAASLGAFHDPSQQHHPLMPQDQVFAELRHIMTRLDARDAELAAAAKAVFGWHDGHGFCSRCGAASQVTMAGWQRTCPACQSHHFPRTDPVVIMLITHGNALLLGRSPGWPEGMYSLLAGFIEPGETVEAAVRREVFEEAGIVVGPVRYLASQPWPFPASLMLGCRGEAVSTAITLDPAELEAALWVSRERLAQIFAGHDPQITPPRPGAIAHFLMRNWLADALD